MFSLLFCLLYLNIFNATALLLINENQTAASSDECLLHIVNKYFISSIAIFPDAASTEVLSPIYKSSSLSKRVLNITMFHGTLFNTHINHAIIINSNLEDFIINAKWMKSLNLWNARARYIFYVSENVEKSIQDFIKTLWNYYINNVIIIMPSSHDVQIFNIYSYYPFVNNSCGNTRPQLIDNCINGSLKQNAELFPNKIPNKLPGCKVKTRAQICPLAVLPPKTKIVENEPLIISEGVETQLYLVIAKAMNFSIEFYSTNKPADWGIVTADGKNATGAIKLLIDRKIDFAIGCFGSVEERWVHCDHTTQHYEVQVVWGVPRAQEVPRWQNLISTFQIPAWIAMLLLYFTVSFIIWSFAYCEPKEKSSFVKLKNCYVYIYSTFFGISAGDTPKKSSVRISFFIWLVFGLHFVAAYNAKLVSVLLSPNYEKQISTMSEMIDSGLELRIILPHKRYFTIGTDNILDKILSVAKICDDPELCLKRVAVERDAAFLYLRDTSNFLTYKYRKADGEPLLHYILFNVNTVEWYMTKGHPFRDRINKFIYRLRDSGLLFKWQKDIESEWLFRYMRLKKTEDSTNEALALIHVQGAFALLVIGLIFASLVFFGELFYHCLKYKQRFQDEISCT